jgi:predicted GNAT family acetyltransferase
MTDTSQRVDVRNVEDALRYELWVDGGMAGRLEYRSLPRRIILDHTEVEPEFDGRGYGSLLARRALDDARTAGQRVIPLCPFIRGWLKRHPEYADVILPPEGQSE